MNKPLLLILGAVLFATAGVGQETLPRRFDQFKAISQDLVQGRSIELDALEIKARIQEPALIYILDRPNAGLEFLEDSPEFSDRIFWPIMRNEFK